MVLGILGDKAIDEMLELIIPLADAGIIVTAPQSLRASDPWAVAEKVRKYARTAPLLSFRQWKMPFAGQWPAQLPMKPCVFWLPLYGKRGTPGFKRAGSIRRIVMSFSFFLNLNIITKYHAKNRDCNKGFPGVRREYVCFGLI